MALSSVIPIGVTAVGVDTADSPAPGESPVPSLSCQTCGGTALSLIVFCPVPGFSDKSHQELHCQAVLTVVFD